MLRVERYLVIGKERIARLHFSNFPTRVFHSPRFYRHFSCICSLLSAEFAMFYWRWFQGDEGGRDTNWFLGRRTKRQQSTKRKSRIPRRIRPIELLLESLGVPLCLESLPMFYLCILYSLLIYLDIRNYVYLRGNLFHKISIRVVIFTKIFPLLKIGIRFIYISRVM